MRRALDEGYEFEGVGYQLRVYDDPSGKELDSFLIFEPREGQDRLFDFKRSEIAEYVTGRLGKGLDEITWLEQSPDGALRQFDFSKSFAYSQSDLAYDIPTPEEHRQALAQDQLTMTRGIFVPSKQLESAEVNRLETKLGEKVEPYLTRQEPEYQQMKGTAKDFDEERKEEIAKEYGIDRKEYEIDL